MRRPGTDSTTRNGKHAFAGAGGHAAQGDQDRLRAGAASTRSLHEAAHKLGERALPAPPVRGPKRSAAARWAESADRDVVAHGARAALALGALGVVYGDLGTSPLYTEQFIFTAHRDAAHADLAGVYGIVSLIFWALLIEVTLKYAALIMRAHNHGDGGIMALTALVRRVRARHTAALVVLGVFGAGLFLGDGMITPAISVTSAVGGLGVVSPRLAHLVVPLSLGILIALFALQRFGTAAVGWLFGPVILTFFASIAALGMREVVAHPGVVAGLSPVWGIRFLVDHGAAGWLTLGGVVLCCTGAEAMSADRGHFGAGPIRMTWVGVVLPAVMISYLGQAALILSHPGIVNSPSFNPFFQLVPRSLLVPMVVLATLATIIASQAVITGSFSVARQATQLGLLPRLRTIHTSEIEGQIYVPAINWLLGAGVATLVLVFRNPTTLGNIYGVAVTGTFLLNTILFVAIARAQWHTPRVWLVLVAVLFGTVDLAFFSSNLTKLVDGAYVPLAVGLAVAVVMLTWQRGAQIVTRNRTEAEGSLEEFLERLRFARPPILRLPGTAIYVAPGVRTTPLAMRTLVEHNRALHERVLIVSVQPVGVPHVDRSERFAAETIGSGLFKVTHLTIRVGYRDPWRVPDALALARKEGYLDRALDLEHASYFVSRMTIVPTDAPGMARWRKRLFVAMARNADSPVEHFGLPVARTAMTTSRVPV
ncbi:MAG TPA: KUP/HAK/KT family potassium transporter [Solirubrobacteraceae bacterium]|nr:KUP/HAK/KT family potassium transporter [Solirubrobacteraceae bacterium]